ncbi:MAG: hypothetical protein PHS02_04225, partial [Candidatus ainarchaeum sp.]|nr:hypothetical protein [Candidatus ainarchaeum sp.]
MAQHGSTCKNSYAWWKKPGRYVRPSESIMQEARIGHTGSNLTQPGSGSSKEKILAEPKNGPHAGEIREKTFKLKDDITGLLKNYKFEEALKKLREADELLKSGPNDDDHGLFKTAGEHIFKCMRHHEFDAKSGGAVRRCLAWLGAREGNYKRALEDYVSAVERYLSDGSACTTDCAKN